MLFDQAQSTWRQSGHLSLGRRQRRGSRADDRDDRCHHPGLRSHRQGSLNAHDIREGHTVDDDIRAADTGEDAMRDDG